MSVVVLAVELLKEKFGDDVLDVVEYRDEMTVTIRPSALLEIMQFLRDEEQLKFNFLVDITAVDWLEREPRFDVVYHLLSMSTLTPLRMVTQVGEEGEENPEIASVVSAWSAANWYEREIYDLFGIVFTGHPDLRRIVMPEDWTTFPLRKDYPLTGITLPEPRWGGQVPDPSAEPHPITRGTSG